MISVKSRSKMQSNHASYMYYAYFTFTWRTQCAWEALALKT